MKFSIFILSALTGWVLIAVGGSFHFGETRYLPRKFSEPQIENHGDGKKTFKPSIATDFKKYEFGSAGEIRSTNVKGKETVTLTRSHVDLRLKDSGHVIRVYEGQVFHAGDKRYKLLSVWTSGIEYRNLETGIVHRKMR